MSLYGGAILGLARDTLGVFDRVLNPLLLLGVRLWLAMIFLNHGLDTAMAAPERMFGVDPQVTIEIVAAVLLALGLITRLAAVPIAFLSLIVYFGDRDVTGHVLCALLALALTVHGPGPISLDALLGRGVGRAALPFAQWPDRIIRAFQAVTQPVLQLLLRVWMAGLFWMTGEALINAGDTRWIDYGSLASEAWLAPFTGSTALMGLQLVAAVMLAVGFGTRLAALVLALLTVSVMTGPSGLPEHLLWALILGHLLFAGPGPLSIDRLIDGWLQRNFPEYTGKPAFSLENCPHVVIVGAGFGGLAAARALAKTRVRVTVIDRHNYHLFQPLLYQVATASLSPADIAVPIRGTLREQFNTRVLFGKVTGIDTAAKQVLIGEDRIAYDHLILATGARHAYFGRDDWEPLAPGLKKIDDATHVRQRILLAFERAESVEDPAERARLLTFIVVGAGPTGVELAGAIAELAKQGMEKDFRSIDPASARVILVQAGPRVLPMFPERLSATAQASLEDLGVEVRLNGRVTEMDADGVAIGDERIPSGTILWAAGVRASRAAKWLGCGADRAGRVIVGPDLTVPGHPDIFVVGDTAAMTTPDGQPVPGLAPAAKQSGLYAAKVISARVAGRPDPGPFQYRHMGSLATIGRDSAVADFGWLKLSGQPAWWLWGVVHVLFLLGTRNRLSVMLSWIWSYLSYRRSTRLITGPVEEAEAPRTMPAAAE